MICVKKLNGADYRIVLRRGLMPFWRRNRNGNFIFQHDGVPINRARKSTELLTRRNVSVPVSTPKRHQSSTNDNSIIGSIQFFDTNRGLIRPVDAMAAQIITSPPLWLRGENLNFFFWRLCQKERYSSGPSVPNDSLWCEEL